MAVFQPFNQTIADLANGVHNLGADTLKFMFTNTAPTAADSVKADITEIAAGNGYTAGGFTCGITSSSQTGGAYSLVPTGDVVVTASGGDIATFRYVVLYNDTATNKNLISFYDYGKLAELGDGENFTVDVGASLLGGSTQAA